jgi:hypothetical protein
MIHAFSCYVTSVYPEALELCRSIDSISKQIMKGEPCRAPEAEMLAKIDLYTQLDEKERNNCRIDWRTPDAATHVMEILF